MACEFTRPKLFSELDLCGWAYARFVKDNAEPTCLTMAEPPFGPRPIQSATSWMLGTVADTRINRILVPRAFILEITTSRVLPRVSLRTWIYERRYILVQASDRDTHTSSTRNNWIWERILSCSDLWSSWNSISWVYAPTTYQFLVRLSHFSAVVTLYIYISARNKDSTN